MKISEWSSSTELQIQSSPIPNLKFMYVVTAQARIAIARSIHRLVQEGEIVILTKHT